MRGIYLTMGGWFIHTGVTFSLQQMIPDRHCSYDEDQQRFLFSNIRCLSAISSIQGLV